MIDFFLCGIVTSRSLFPIRTITTFLFFCCCSFLKPDTTNFSGLSTETDSFYSICPTWNLSRELSRKWQRCDSCFKVIFFHVDTLTQKKNKTLSVGLRCTEFFRHLAGILGKTRKSLRVAKPERQQSSMKEAGKSRTSLTFKILSNYLMAKDSLLPLKICSCFHAPVFLNYIISLPITEAESP